MMWWLSFVDPHKPPGHRFLGVVILAGENFGEAVRNAWTLGCNPGGEVKGYQVEDVDPTWMNRLLDSQEADEVNKMWDPHGTH